MNHEPGALDGIRIVDLTQHVAGPYCTMLLAGMGADVVKVEPPSGEAGRQVAPFVHDHRDIEASLRFLHLNRAKRSVVLDATSQDGRLALRELTAGADVLILDEAPARALALWGIDEDELRSDRPTLTLVSLPPFASGTPWSDWLGSELILAAVCGSASCTGEADRLPLESGGYLSLVAQGQTAAVATLAALLAVRRGGAGTYVEVAGSEANAEMFQELRQRLRRQLLCRAAHAQQQIQRDALPVSPPHRAGHGGHRCLLARTWGSGDLAACRRAITAAIAATAASSKVRTATAASALASSSAGETRVR